ncbi:MAG: hypothetical protein OER93_01850 [Thermoleophilia bacterium]|nr:hypothetical protein [Thermoleophilia bacterium]
MMIAAALFAMAVPAHALAAGPALSTAFGPLALVGLLLIVAGLLFLFGPDLLRRRSSRAQAEDSAAAAPQAPAGTEASAADSPETRTLKYREAQIDVNEGEQAEGRKEPVAADGPRSQPAASAQAPPVPPREQAERRPAGSSTTPDERQPLGEVYGPETCTEYAGGLSDQVLGRAKVFFASLAREGEIDSTKLADSLDAIPTQLAGLLLTPLTRRAEAINAPSPFRLGRVKGTRRRLWLDQDGVAARLGRAIDREIAMRSGSSAAAGGNGAGQGADHQAVAEDLASLRATGG